MTTATEKAAPIPAEDASGVDIQRLADRCAQSVYSSIGKRDITKPIKEAIVDAILADRASQEERIREAKAIIGRPSTRTLTNEAADRIAALEAEASEDARRLGQADEKIANLSGEIDRLKRDLARVEAEASEGERRGLERAAEVADQLDANADDIGAAIRALVKKEASR